jgi:hypothetical protein
MADGTITGEAWDDAAGAASRMSRRATGDDALLKTAAWESLDDVPWEAALRVVEELVKLDTPATDHRVSSF